MRTTRRSTERHLSRDALGSAKGAADCASADVRARVDSKEVRHWIKSQIDRRFPY
jgi:hypothetical protein